MKKLMLGLGEVKVGDLITLKDGHVGEIIAIAPKIGKIIVAAHGYDASAASERLGHSDGGALFLRTYRHLLAGERRRNADRFGAAIRATLDQADQQREAQA